GRTTTIFLPDMMACDRYSTVLPLEDLKPVFRLRRILPGVVAPAILGAIHRNDIDDTLEIVAPADILFRPIEDEALGARTFRPRGRHIHRYDILRARRLDLGDHLFLHALGVSLVLHQWVCIEVASRGAPFSIEEDLGLGTEHGDLGRRVGVLSDVWGDGQGLC